MKRAALVAVVLAVSLHTVLPGQAQGPQSPFFVHGRNVNTVGPVPPGPNPLLMGNPAHKQRNEASCDVSPDNPSVILCANNDYRGIEKFNDSWIGLAMSRNASLSWTSRLLSNAPTSPQGLGAADPVVATVPGLGLVSYITLNRTTGRGNLALAVLLERNKENGEPYQELEVRQIGKDGTPGRFSDKPAMEVVLDGTGVIDVGGRSVPRSKIYYAYAMFPGNENNSSSQIYITRTSDYGLIWTSAIKLSESLGTNQGVDVAAVGSTVLAVWRQVADTNQSDAMVFARSTDGGATFSKAAVLWSGPGRFFDQDTTELKFRTLSMPSIVHDGTAFHVFFSARGFAGNGFADDARIVVSSSRDGRQWSNPVVVDNSFTGRGHQIIPQSAVAGGRIQVNWIDTRHNESVSFGKFIEDFRVDANGNRVPLTDPAGEGAPPTFVYRNMADIFGTQSFAAAPTGQPALSFGTPAQVSRYRFGLIDGEVRQLDYHFINARMFKLGTVPFNGDYHAVASQRYRPSEITAGQYIPNTAASTNHAIFYSAFTDNREVQGYVWAGPPSTSFTPGATLEGESGSETPVACDTTNSETTPDITVWSPTDSPRARYQNIYAASTFPGLVVTSRSASKPTGTLERAYVIVAHNLEGTDNTYRFSIDPPPAGVQRVSFRQDDPTVPETSCVPGTGCRAMDVAITRGSSASRTVYVQSTLTHPRIVVRVQQTGGGTQTGSVIINANPDVAPIENADGVLQDITQFELYQPDILSRQTTVYSAALVNPDVMPIQGIEFPRVDYPRVDYPRVDYSGVEGPRVDYPRIDYDAVGNPRVDYPRVDYPRVDYQSVANPRLDYSAITDVTTPVGVTEVTWPVATDPDLANTTTALSAKVFVNGTLSGVTGAQLIVSIPTFTTVTRACDGQQVTVVENQVVSNTVLSQGQLGLLAPTPGGPDTVNPPFTQPSFALEPKQVAFLTLRLIGRADALLANRAGVIVRSQPDTTDGDVADEAKDGGFVDVTPPTIDLGGLAGGTTVEGNASGGATVGVTVSATDAGGGVTLSCVRTGDGGTTTVPTNGTPVFYALGAYQVTCTAVDESSNQSTAGFPVTVQDTTAPALNLSGMTLTLVPTPGGASVTYSPATATVTDIVDSTPSVACQPPSGTFFAVGTTATITCTATDDTGNVATATKSVLVTDMMAPVLTVPAPITVEATSPAGAVANFSVTAVDDIDTTPTVACTHVSGATFPLGTTTVSCTATDDAGNASTKTFTVAVRDTTAPTSIVATINPSLLWPPNGALIPVTISGTALDGGSGIGTIRWSVVDEYGQYQPSGSVALPGNGPFSFQVPLLADRRGNDKDGRHYRIELTAVDKAGNTLLLAQPLVVNVHDQSGF